MTFHGTKDDSVTFSAFAELYRSAQKGNSMFMRGYFFLLWAAQATQGKDCSLHVESKNNNHLLWSLPKKTTCQLCLKDSFYVTGPNRELSRGFKLLNATCSVFQMLRCKGCACTRMLHNIRHWLDLEPFEKYTEARETVLLLLCHWWKIHLVYALSFVNMH